MFEYYDHSRKSVPANIFCIRKLKLHIQNYEQDIDVSPTI